MKRTQIAPWLSGASALVLAASFMACQEAPTHTAEDRLQGFWEGTDDDYSISISGNSLFFYGREDFWYDAEFELPAGTDPTQLHATILRDNSGEDDDVGTVIVAIYKIEDGTLTLVALADGAPRDTFDDDSLGRYDLRRAPPRAGRTRPPNSK